MAVLLLLINLCILPAAVLSADQIPGPHLPSTFGVPGNEIINTGTVPKFLSYSAIDNTGKKHTYVPVFVAVMTDAGESTFKDVRQNSDKLITIQGAGTFWCAFGHPYRQFAFQDKYKWDIKKQKILDIPGTTMIPVKPLIRSFLVESHVVTSIMMGATTENFNKVGGTRDINVDHVATNQFGISLESRKKLEMAALPGSLVTYVEGLKDLDPEKNYKEIANTWGQIEDVSFLKARFNVPTETFSNSDSSMFVTENVKIATSDDIREKLGQEFENSKWKKYAECLREMEYSPIVNNPDQPEMHTLQSDQISKYPVRDFADTNTVNDLIQKQNINSNHIRNAKRLLNSFEIIKIATSMETMTWNKNIFVFDFRNTKDINKKLLPLRNNFITHCASLIEGQLNSKSMKKLKNDFEVIKEIKMNNNDNNNFRWRFSSTSDFFLQNLKSVLGFLRRNSFLEDFPFGKNGEKLTKAELLKYFKDGLTNYIQSKKCKLSNENKNIIVRGMNNDKPTKRNIAFTNDKNTNSKIFLHVENSERHIIMPGDQLSLELMGRDVDSTMIKNSLSQMHDSILCVSPTEKIILEFPDTDMDTNSELSWKKRAVQVGDYIRDMNFMKVNHVELTFKNSKSLKYDMISHTIDNGLSKEMPFTFIDGHPVIDNHIVSNDIKRNMEKAYDTHITDGGGKFKDLVDARATDVLLVPYDKGYFLSNKDIGDIKTSVHIDDYKARQIKQPITNEIIIRLETPNEAIPVDDQNKERALTVAEDASNMLVSGYRKKAGKDNLVLISASKEGDTWKVETQSVADNIVTLDNARLTIVGVGDTSPQTGTWRIGGHDSADINKLIKETIAKLNIKDNDLKKVSVVACNPETKGVKSKDVENMAIKLARDIAQENKVSTSTRTGYIKVDADGHKWYSPSAEGVYHRRQEGDVYIAEWKGDTVLPVIEKIKSFDIEDSNVPLSKHLGAFKTVSNEHESEIFKSGWHLKHEIEREFVNDKVDIESKPAPDKSVLNNPKVQRRFQNVGNVMSKYGMLQTAVFLLKAEKCESTNDTSRDACEARKITAITSLSQDTLEIVSDAAKKAFKSMRGTVKLTPKIKPGRMFALKSFGKSVMRNPLKALPVLGVGLDIASLGLDIYNLTRAKTDTEKGIAGTNVALSGISLIASATALGAGLLGATAVAAVAGPAAIVVGVVAFAFNIGVSIWQQKKYEEIHKPLVRQSAKWFEEMKSLYDESWYDCDDATFYFKPGIEVNSVDIANRYMTINSAYLCETQLKGYKSHRRPYPLNAVSWFVSCKGWSSLESSCNCHDIDCPKLINVRYGLDIDGMQHFYCNELKTIVLNTAPVMLYNYGYSYFDKFDPVIGLFDKDLETGTDLGRMIEHEYTGKFYYDKHLVCVDKYAIISNIGLKRYIPSVTELKLDNNHIQVVMPEYKEEWGVSFKLLGVYGTAYSVYLSNSCKVQLQSKPDYFQYPSNITVWKLFIDTELVNLLCTFEGNTNLACEYDSTQIQVVTPEINQVIFTDKSNISSVPLYHNNKMMLYILEIQASTFTSDKELLAMMDRYLKHDFIDLALTYVPVKNVRIQECDNKVIPKAFVSLTLHFTSEYPDSCSYIFNTDAELQLVKKGHVYYSSSLNSLVWKTHYSNNSLDSFVMLPCHSELRSNIFVSDSEDTVYITQKLNVTTSIEITIIYKLTDSRLFLLSISSDFKVPWERLKSVCFDNRKPILSNLNSLVLNTSMLLAGENDLTFVNTSNDLYWVRKLNKQIVGRIFPNVNTTCDSIDMSIPDTAEHISTVHHCTESRNDTSTNNTLYYFLCMKGSDSYTFVQLGNNRAKLVENLNYQQIYFDGNDIFVKNKNNTFTVDEASPTKVCLFEYEMNLPNEYVESMEELMVQISEQYECIESKVKLKFTQLVGWFDFEEMVAVILHKSINNYKLNAMGTTPDLNRYWIWDTVNRSLYLQETAESADMQRLLNGNITEEEYLAKIRIPEKMISNVQEVSYESGRIYVYTSTGATYYVNENGDREILAVTDFWFKTHPLAERDLKKETNKEFVMYRPDIQDKPSNTRRCKRSSSTEHHPANNFLLYHISFGLFFNVDLEESVFIGSNRNNMSLLIYNFQSGSLLEVNEQGVVIGEDRYNILHRINDKTLTVETNKYTESSVPPSIDNIETIILSTSDPEFTFNITQRYWSQIDEILVSDDTETLSVYLDMVPCVYELENIDDRVLLVDYAFRRKLIIPNAEERSRENRITFYVCGERIKLHETNENLDLIIATLISAAFVVFVIVLVICVLRRRRRIRKSSKENVEVVREEVEVVGEEVEMQDVRPLPVEVVRDEVEMQDVRPPPVQTKQTNILELNASLLSDLNGKIQQRCIKGSYENLQENRPLFSNYNAALDTSHQTHKDDVLIKYKPVTLTAGVGWHNNKMKND